MNRFDIYQPSDGLKPYVRHFAISESVAEQAYKVLPGTALVMGLQYRGKLIQVIDETESPLATAGITGLQNRFQVFRNSPNTGTVLVYFTETGAAAFFKVPINELFSESVSLDTFIAKSQLEAVQEQLTDAQADKQRLTIVEQFLLSQLHDAPTDLLVTTALHYIMTAKGMIRIKHLADELHISQSPLEKRFRRVVGTSPKKFASIVRFQTLLNTYSPETSLTEVAYQSGYFDQAHFIKDFKRFTGEAPEKFFRSE